MNYILIIALTALPTTSHAYFDIGTGSLIIQAIVASLGIAIVFLANLKDHILIFLRLKKPKIEDPETNTKEKKPRKTKKATTKTKAKTKQPKTQNAKTKS